FLHGLGLDNDPVHPVLHGWLNVHRPSRFQYWSDGANGGQTCVSVPKVQIHYHPYSVANRLKISSVDTVSQFSAIHPSWESHLSSETGQGDWHFQSVIDRPPCPFSVY